MADTFTANYNFTKPQIGGDTNTWGTVLNANFDAIDTQVKANATAAASAAAAAAAAVLAVPGMIIMWAGTIAAIPAKWKICDGTNGTPDLRGRMVIGAGGAYAVGNVGGSSSAGITIANMPAHNHGVTDPGHAHGVYDPGHSHGVSDPGHAHSVPNYIGGTPGHVVWGGSQVQSDGSMGYATTTASGTGISINGSGTGIGIYGSGTGIQTQVAGSGAAFSVQNPYMALAYLMYTG